MSTGVRDRAAARAAALLTVTAALAGLAAGGPAPASAGPPGGAFVSDDFNAPSLGTSRWSVVDPVGDGEVATVGAGTGDAHLSLSVPAGVSHDAWTTNNSLRAVQAVGDADVDVVAAFDSTPAAKFQMQGLMSVQADGTFVRYGVHHTGSGLRLFAATVSPTSWARHLDVPVEAGQADILRMTRDGDNWTLRYSADGQSWTTATTFNAPFALSSLGVYAGNHAFGGAAPPAYTARVDYVFDTANPIVPEDGQSDPPDDDTPPVITEVAVDAGTDTATVSWTTDEPATSAVAFGPTTSYGASVSDNAYVIAHAVALTGLDPGTTYQFSANSTNLAGHEAASTNGSFTTGAPQPASGFASDDFRSGFDTSVWTTVDPAGDGTVGIVAADQTSPCDSRLQLGVPAGVKHDPWITNTSLRVMQDVGDHDLDMAAGFGSMPTEPYQMQGLLLQQSDAVYVRFGVHHNGSAVRLYGATFAGTGAATKRVDATVDAAAAMFLRVTRTGDTWALAHSGDGESWTTAATFSFPMTMSGAGVFVGNSGAGSAPPPAYTAEVDYVFDLDDPIVPEDGDGDCEGYPLTTEVWGQGSIIRSPAAESYAPGTSVTLVAVPAEGWELAGWGGAASGSANATTVTITGPLTVSATFVEGEPSPPGVGPVVDVWGGDEQTYGALGQPQTWVNVRGNVSDPDGVTSLSYTLNGGPSRPLSRGSDLRRLYGAGDFNAEIGYDELDPGPNTVVISAVDGAGHSSTRTVTVNRVTETTWPLPYSTDWATASTIDERAQVVDGKWALEGATLRAIEPGYDRTVALGDLTWTDYEVTVPVTVHELSPGYGTPQSGGPLVGLGLRWRGHAALGSEQPRLGWYPTGAFAWYRWQNASGYRLSGNNDWPVAGFAQPAIEFGTTYVFKARVTTAAQGAEYSFKVWEMGSPEPVAWTKTIVDADSPESGGVLLIAHHVVANWGDVVVTPIEP